MEINGVAHTFITAGDFAAARAFYGQLLPFLGFTVVADSVNTFYCVGGRTGFGIHGAAPEFAGQRFRQGMVGLHHHCFRARERGDVDEAHDFLIKIGANIIHAPREDGFAPGYYSVLFEDPDGTRLRYADWWWLRRWYADVEEVECDGQSARDAWSLTSARPNGT